MRPAGRSVQQVRPVTITRHFTQHAEGSVLIAFGETRVLCTASVEKGVPRFLKGQGHGWITAEYGMLPCAAPYPQSPRGGERQARRPHPVNSTSYRQLAARGGGFEQIE